MNLPLFLALRIFRTGNDNDKVSRPAVHIAVLGVAIGLAVMILTVSVVVGFKNTIRDKVAGFGSHIQVSNFLAMQTTDLYPVYIDDSMLTVLGGIGGVRHAERYALTTGVLKTEDDFLGITFKGVAQEYDYSFLNANLIEGEIPAFTDSTASNSLLLSRTAADKLKLSVGDKLFAYFISEDVRARRFVVSGIYMTNMAQFDEAICFTDLYTVARLNKWQPNQCSGAELLVNDFDAIDAIAANVYETIGQTYDDEGNAYTAHTIYETYPQVFSWLDLLDVNVWIILALMVCVAGFTMISGLLIIILERTRMIGTLKALGATNNSVRHTFLWLATFVIGRGLLWGNILGIGIVVLQNYTGFITLDPEAYYVNTAPMELNLSYVLMLNIATLIICVMVLIAPSFLISHIHPAKSMHYE